MLIQTPTPLSQPDRLLLAQFLDHPGKVICERVVRSQIAAAINQSNDIALQTPMNVLAKGPESQKARDLNIAAARLTIFLQVLAELSRPETEFELAKFEVE